MQQFLIKFNLSRPCLAIALVRSTEVHESLIYFFLSRLNDSFYLILSKRFFHPSDSDLPPQKIPVSTQLKPHSFNFKFFSSQLCQTSLFVSYSSIFKCLKVFKRLKQAKVHMQKMPGHVSLKVTCCEAMSALTNGASKW